MPQNERCLLLSYGFLLSMPYGDDFFYGSKGKPEMTVPAGRIKDGPI
jgi:hypothetical protein